MKDQKSPRLRTSSTYNSCRYPCSLFLSAPRPPPFHPAAVFPFYSSPSVTVYRLDRFSRLPPAAASCGFAFSPLPALSPQPFALNSLYPSQLNALRKSIAFSAPSRNSCICSSLLMLKSSQLNSWSASMRQINCL